MTFERVREALAACASIIRDRAYVREAKRSESLGVLVVAESPLPHLLFMCEEASTFPPARLEKAMRWLGFVQGALWARGWISVEEAKRQNMPEGEEFRP